MMTLSWTGAYDVIFFAFGQCRHVNSSMMSDFPL